MDHTGDAGFSPRVALCRPPFSIAMVPRMRLRALDGGPKSVFAVLKPIQKGDFTHLFCAVTHHPLPTTSELFERYGAMVHRRCSAMLGAEELARDATQEVFLRVLERRHQFRGESAPSTWLYTIATLHCLQFLRDRAAHQAKLTLFATESAPFTRAGLEDHLSLVALLNRESEDVQLMVYLHHVDGMTLDEVAEIVGYSRKTVSKKVHEFLSSARKSLSIEGQAL